MKTIHACTLALCAATATGGTPAARASDFKAESGSVCQPTTPQDAAVIHYLDGTVTVTAPASVTCPLTGVVPGYEQTKAIITLYNGSGEWKSSGCEFQNGYATRSLSVPILGLPGREHIGIATFPTAKAGFVAYAAVCTLYPGQQLYGVSVDLQAL